ncbi:hypothetical protein [Dialister sp.]|uniref:hypothetical protein n=1 Tax=Dialister sp. TaxID=1955814 RepID=UPI00406D51F8
MEQKLDYAIDVDVPDENIIHSYGSGRRACVGCGATYHVACAILQRLKAICDVCGEALILQ